MYSTIYIENEVRSHSKVNSIIGRYPDARIVSCDSYSEVFNRSSQDFRLQKQLPSLILACKNQNHVLRAPEGYGVGSAHNYYFSTMLNCVYDCRYCFLQGMYRSAHHVVFVNFDDYWNAISATVEAHCNDDEVWFFSGYDCDSLAMEPVVGFADYFVKAFESHPNAMLELRTKSTQIRSMLSRRPLANVVTAFSMTPQEISSRLEHKVPTVSKRIEAMSNLQKQGWPLGLRFDPLIYQDEFKTAYRGLFDAIFNKLDSNLIHSVSVGAFRLPRSFYRKMVNLYPDDKFLSLPFESSSGMVSYPKNMENEMIDWCVESLAGYIDSDRIFRATIE